jgi:hypothetical protein
VRKSMTLARSSTAASTDAPVATDGLSPARDSCDVEMGERLRQLSEQCVFGAVFGTKSPVNFELETVDYRRPSRIILLRYEVD